MQGPEGAEGAEGAEGNVCSLCPVTEGEREHLPVQPELDGAPMSELRCGHQVHTHCLINELFQRRVRAACAHCHITLMQDEAINFYNNDRENIAPQTIAVLWAENEEFRNDVKEYKKLIVKGASTNRVYSKERSVVKNRFKQTILTSVEVIKDQQRQARAELNRLESGKIYKRAASAIQRKRNYMHTKWNINSWMLRELNEVEGAPKISNYYIQRYCYSPKYIFRIRI